MSGTVPVTPPWDPAGPLGEVPGWDLVARCRCKTVVLHHARLLRRHGPAMRADSLLARLRCSRCGERPTEAAWVESAQRAAVGWPGPPVGRVEVPGWGA